MERGDIVTTVERSHYKGTFECRGRTIPLTTSAETEDRAMADFVYQLAHQLHRGGVEVATMMLTGEIRCRVEKVEEGTLCEDRDTRGGYLVP